MYMKANTLLSTLPFVWFHKHISYDILASLSPQYSMLGEILTRFLGWSHQCLCLSTMLLCPLCWLLMAEYWYDDLFNTYTSKPSCWNGWISDSCCSLKPLCSGMGEVVPARTSPTLLPPSPRTVLSLSCFKVSQCINCRDWHFKS